MQVGNEFDTNSKMPEIAESMISREEEDDQDGFDFTQSRDPADLKHQDVMNERDLKLPQIRHKKITNNFIELSADILQDDG